MSKFNRTFTLLMEQHNHNYRVCNNVTLFIEQEWPRYFSNSSLLCESSKQTNLLAKVKKFYQTTSGASLLKKLSKKIKVTLPVLLIAASMLAGPISGVTAAEIKDSAKESGIEQVYQKAETDVKSILKDVSLDGLVQQVDKDRTEKETEKVEKETAASNIKNETSAHKKWRADKAAAKTAAYAEAKETNNSKLSPELPSNNWDANYNKANPEPSWTATSQVK